MSMFSDEMLTAFLDGELPEAQMQQIATALETDSVLQQRLDSLQVDFAPIRAAFDELLSSEQIEKLQQDINLPPSEMAEPSVVQSTVDSPTPKPANDSSWLKYATAACLVLATGFSLGRFTQQPPQTPVAEAPKITWKGEVARYQKLFTKETLAPFSVDAITANKQITAAIESLKLKLSAEQLLQDGLDFKRAQMLAFNKKPLAQFMYQDADGTPIAICVLKSDGDDKALSLANIKGLNSASWKTDGFAYILIGDTDMERIEGLAKNVIAKI